MLAVGDRYESSRGTVVKIASREGGRLSLERAYAPDTGRADPHYHLDFTQTWEALEGEARASFDPTTPFIEAFAEAWVEHLRENTSTSQDEMPLLHILAIARETDGQSFRAGVPRTLQRASLPLIAVLARLRGFKTCYDH